MHGDRPAYGVEEIETKIDSTVGNIHQPNWAWGSTISPGIALAIDIE